MTIALGLFIAVACLTMISGAIMTERSGDTLTTMTGAVIAGIGFVAAAVAFSTLL